MEKVIYKTKGTIRKKMGKYFIRQCLKCTNNFETRYASVYCSKSCAASVRKNTLGKNWSLSLSRRIEMSMNISSEKNPNWKGGITKLNEKIRKSLDYKLWREAVFKRDNHTCVLCFAKSKKGKRVTLNADHIKSFSEYPELRFAIDNGRTLCVDCHRKTDTYGVKLKNI